MTPTECERVTCVICRAPFSQLPNRFEIIVVVLLLYHVKMTKSSFFAVLKNFIKRINATAIAVAFYNDQNVDLFANVTERFLLQRVYFHGLQQLS